MEPFSIFHPDNVGCSELSPGSGLWSSKVPLRARLMIPGKAIASTTILNWSIGNTESRQANFSLVKMVMPIAGNDGPMGPGPLGPWALAHWPMGPGPLGPGPWALAHWPMGPGPWALAHWALAHWGFRGTKNIDFSKSLGMASPGVENVGVPRGSVFKLSRASQLPYSENQKT